jgi:ribonuclease P protein component
MSRATFPAAARLHRPTEFAAALGGKRIARGAYFIVIARPTSIPSDIPSGTDADLVAPVARLGLIMAKRFAHHASTRNALKRVVREAFRSQRLLLPCADYVVKLNRRIQDISLTQLKMAARLEVDAHFMKARA